MGRRHVPHEITMIAIGEHHATGERVVWDIVETSDRNASIFGRRWVANPMQSDGFRIVEIITSRPGGAEHKHILAA